MSDSYLTESTEKIKGYIEYIEKMFVDCPNMFGDEYLRLHERLSKLKIEYLRRTVKNVDISWKET